MNLDVYVLLAGIAATLLTSLVTQEHWAAKTKQSVNAVLALVGGLAALYLKAKGLDPTVVAGLAATSIFGISQGTYAFLYKNTKLAAILSAVGSAKLPAAVAPSDPAPEAPKA